jgi:Protein of unknown function (DUF2778)
MGGYVNIVFNISNGLIHLDDGTELGTAYSGNGPSMNNPNDVSVKNHGPIPPGLYSIGRPVNFIGGVGQLALPLEPDKINVMYGRSGFFIHGDNSKFNHSASDGCIITARSVREFISNYPKIRVNI